ncbi:RcnB family protein [Sphingomonadaceae bacterium jetA1]|uniref:RcnB family protein n=1 Tax=Facivitalis istanbulensis TaxID=3075838 RepID=UPI00349AF7E0
MRIVSPLIALSLVTGVATPALAQSRAGASYPRPAIDTAPPSMDRPVVTTRTVGDARAASQRWGSRVDGRWWGGANAPGGWTAYRRPVRGTALPGYWSGSRFAVEDWAAYRLPQPPAGYRWSRYYDDAVLIDSRGTVYDSVYDVEWDGPATPRYAGAGYPPPPPRPERRDSGLGGAAMGAVAGGVAGGAIAGRGDRLGGALIGAGVGAAAGYAIDRAEDRRRHMEPGYDDYGRPDYGYPGDYPAPPPPPPATGQRWVTRDGSTVTTTTTVGTLASGQSGYFDGGYYYPAPTVTTVVVQQPPVTTTTTTSTTQVVRSAPRRGPVRGKRVRR